MGKAGESDLSKVIAFPVRLARPGRVFCKRIGVYFPILYRITVTTTLNDLELIGLKDIPDCKPGIWIYFELDPEQNYVGTQIIEPATHIRSEESTESIVIRYHTSIEAAYGHLRGYNDVFMADSKNTCSLYKTADGIFTCFAIPTHSAWSGPLVFYLADVPGDNFVGEDAWAYVVGPDGVALEPRDFGFSS